MPERPLLSGRGFVLRFDIDASTKFFNALKATCKYDHTKERINVISKTMGDGNVFEIERHSDTIVYVTYQGTVDDVGHMRFLVDSIYSDLAACRLVAEKDPDYVAGSHTSQPQPHQQSMIPDDELS